MAYSSPRPFRRKQKNRGGRAWPGWNRRAVGVVLAVTTPTKGAWLLPVAPPSEQQLAVAVDLEDAAQALLGRGQALLGALPWRGGSDVSAVTSARRVTSRARPNNGTTPPPASNKMSL